MSTKIIHRAARPLLFALAATCALLHPGTRSAQKAPLPAIASFPAAVASAPSEVEFFRAHEVMAGVELSWMAVSENDIDGFRIYRRKSSQPVYLVINQEGLIGAWRFDYMDGGPEKGQTYLYVLGVVHTDGSEQFSHPVEVTTTARAID